MVWSVQMPPPSPSSTSLWQFWRMMNQLKTARFVAKPSRARFSLSYTYIVISFRQTQDESLLIHEGQAIPFDGISRAKTANRRESKSIRSVNKFSDSLKKLPNTLSLHIKPKSWLRLQERKRQKVSRHGNLGVLTVLIEQIWTRWLIRWGPVHLQWTSTIASPSIAARR